MSGSNKCIAESNLEIVVKSKLVKSKLSPRGGCSLEVVETHP